MDRMVDCLSSAIATNQKLVIVSDYDADGATSCALAKLGLSLFGANNVSYVVPNRFEFGYGLTAELVNAVLTEDPSILITVDNGIANFDGVDAARAIGWTVLITDHHLPANELPDADAIVNPNLPDCHFPSKCLAGVGVMFYVLMGLRIRLREMGWFENSGIKEPNLAHLLDFVALGTIADLVPLDLVNRTLVQQGILRIRANQSHPGINALLKVANRATHSLVSSDLAFSVAPRLNAAGRLDDMNLGIECLLAENDSTAIKLAVKLDELNHERREIENQMKLEAMSMLEKNDLAKDNMNSAAICLFDDGWHQGVIGILASRVKEQHNKPVIAFAPSTGTEIRGSARSIAGVHIRDVLCDVAAKCPGIIKKFGGHAMAAGLTLDQENFGVFKSAFEETVGGYLEFVENNHVVWTDGNLSDDLINLEFAEMLANTEPWGQSFPEPTFEGVFDVLEVRILKEKHVKFLLPLTEYEKCIDAIAFYVDEPEEWLRCQRIKVAFRLNINEYRSSRTLQLIVEHVEKLE